MSQAVRETSTPAVELNQSSLKEFWFFFRQNKGAVAGLVVILAFLMVAIFAPLLAPYPESQVFPEELKRAPFWNAGHDPRFILGTDELGRDLLSRLIYGAQVSLGIGFLVVIFSTSFGATIGLIAGYRGGWVDKVVMRSVDILSSLPSILLAIVVVSILGPNLFNAIVAVSIVAVPGFVRILRAAVIAERGKQYVVASKSFGASGFRVLFINILPNCMAPLIVQAALCFSDGILNAAALGFLGLGAQPPTAEWGTMLADAREYIRSHPHLVTIPGMCISIVVLGFNLLGDGLRDAFDPRLKK